MSQTRVVNPCPICSSTESIYLFEMYGDFLWTCRECNLTFSSSSRSESGNEYLANHHNKSQTSSKPLEGITEVEASKKYLKMLAARRPELKNILLVAERGHCFAEIANDFGFNIEYHITVADIEDGVDLSKSVDAVVIIYQLEKAKTVQLVLNRLYTVLKPNGELFMVVLSLDSFSANFFSQSWIGWRPENHYYFDNTNIQLLLWRFGFNEVSINKDVRSYTLNHINERASTFPNTWLTSIIQILFKLLPTNFHYWRFPLPSSGIIVMARKSERRATPTLSIVIPVYNESTTFSLLMDKLLDLELDNIQKEIIIVESNSKDNSRELVMKHQGNSDVKIVLQEKALGKGNAVREGFTHARGDILLIQDADLEYDLNDYEALLEPIKNFRVPFVLGARHGGKWKMRHFNDQQHLSTYFNFGHIIFTALINLLYRQKLKDPFTMFKVFRRDCLYNLKFDSNRFDFDFELVIKLIRKGYIPIEIPVNYYSRSFKEGKKVNMFRDPLTWIWALLKYRFSNINKDS